VCDVILVIGKTPSLPYIKLNTYGSLIDDMWAYGGIFKVIEVIF